MSSSEQLCLPQEIVNQILLKLPVKSLVRFRGVCKSWHSLIGDPSFISLHRRLNSQSFILFRLFEKANHNSEPIFSPFLRLHHNHFLTPAANSSLPPPLHLPPAFIGYSYVVGICHGLICITNFDPLDNDDHQDEDKSIIICNPSLRRFLSIPRPLPTPEPIGHHHATLAFGFDSRNNDYKILRIVTGAGFSFNDFPPRFEVYSLASGFWSTLNVVVSPFTISYGHGEIIASHGFVNGLVHWATRRKVEDGCGYFVLSFDFVDEVFHWVDLPESIARSSYMAMVSVVGGGNGKDLIVYHLSDDSPSTGSIWVMKEYNVVESWNKIFHFELTEFCLKVPSFGITIPDVVLALVVPLCVTDHGEKLLVQLNFKSGNKCLYVLDLENKRFTILESGVKWWWELYPDYFVETMVLLDKDDAGVLTPY